jgi:hypothetical protein
MRFSRLPNLPITAETTDIPFEPIVSYEKLPGGKLNPALQSEAQAVLHVVETTQHAINREDLDSYMATIHPAYPAFAKKARAGAEAQFISGDMKRYTLAVTFNGLSREHAVVEVMFEAFIFFPSGHANHVQATFVYKLKKYEGAWRIYDSRLKGQATGKAIVFAVVGVSMAGVLIGVIVALLAVFQSCDTGDITITSEPKTITIEKSQDITVETPGGVTTAPGTPARPDAEGYYTATTGIPLYRTPDLNTTVTTVITPGVRFRVIEEKGDWFRIQSEDGARGWVPEIIIQANLGNDYKLRR